MDENNGPTTMWVSSKEVLRRLREYKEHPRETDEDVLKRLLDIADVAKAKAQDKGGAL